MLSANGKEERGYEDGSWFSARSAAFGRREVQLTCIYQSRVYSGTYYPYTGDMGLGAVREIRFWDSTFFGIFFDKELCVLCIYCMLFMPFP